MKLLIIEDNPRLSDRMKKQLQKWYIIEIASNGDTGLQYIATQPFDLVILDLGLPDTPGLEVCRHIRSITSSVPIIIVTGIDTIESRVDLLDAGADDYLTKPFNLSELRSRINALMRRSANSESVPIISVGDLIINPSNRRVTRSGHTITLRRKEFDILEYLARNAGRVLSRQMIINHAWPSSSNTWSGSVDVHIKQLRDKVDKPFAYPLIKTLYGVGYMIEKPQNITSHRGTTK